MQDIRSIAIGLSPLPSPSVALIRSELLVDKQTENSSPILPASFPLAIMLVATSLMVL